MMNYNPLGPRVEYTLHLPKFLFKKNKKVASKKISYERRAYESVDVRSLFWVIPHTCKETSTSGLKGIYGICMLHY